MSLSDAAAFGSDIFNTAQQGTASVMSLGSQVAGQGLLWGQIPKNTQGVRDISQWAFNRGNDIYDPVNQRNSERMDQAAHFSNPSKPGQGTAQGDKLNEFDSKQQAAARAFSVGASAAFKHLNDLSNMGRENIDKIQSDSDDAFKQFESDRSNVLGALKSDVAANLEAARSSSLGNAQGAIEAALNDPEVVASGLNNDPAYRQEVQMRVRGQYAEQLGTAARALQSDYQKRMSETYLGLSQQRSELRASTLAAKNTAFGQAQTSEANAAKGFLDVGVEAGKFGEEQARDTTDAFVSLQQSALQVAQAQNMTDNESAAASYAITHERAQNGIMAEQMELQGYGTLAGHIINTEYNVPQSGLADTIAQLRAAQPSGGSSSFSVLGSGYSHSS